MDEADEIVPNEYGTPMKTSWLNDINQDFFNVVKIPKIAKFTTTTSATYTLSSDVREKNIDLVNVGLLRYKSFARDDVPPLHNGYYFDDSTYVITLSPPPYMAGLESIVRFRRRATSTFLSSNLAASPDAPEEYHWTYVPALCEYICLAMDDPKAASFNAQKTAAWNSAAADYRGGP
jgi:hypothetical protein